MSLIIKMSHLCDTFSSKYMVILQKSISNSFTLLTFLAANGHRYGLADIHGFIVESDSGCFQSNFSNCANHGQFLLHVCYSHCFFSFSFSVPRLCVALTAPAASWAFAWPVSFSMIVLTSKKNNLHLSGSLSQMTVVVDLLDSG